MTNTVKKLHEKTIEELADELEQTQIALYNFKNQERAIKDEILALYEVKLGLAYVSKDEPFGTVNFEDGDYRVTFNTPKKVSWEQDGLARLHDEGAPVDVEYSVKEVVYKSQNDAGKEAFNQYRTVEPGAVSVKIERVQK